MPNRAAIRRELDLVRKDSKPVADPFPISQAVPLTPIIFTALSPTPALAARNHDQAFQPARKHRRDFGAPARLDRERHAKRQGRKGGFGGAKVRGMC